MDGFQLQQYQDWLDILILKVKVSNLLVLAEYCLQPAIILEVNMGILESNLMKQTEVQLKKNSQKPSLMPVKRLIEF